MHSLDDYDYNEDKFYSLHTIYYSIGVCESSPYPIFAFIPETFSKPETINKADNTRTTAGDVNGDGKPDILSIKNGKAVLFILIRLKKSG